MNYSPTGAKHRTHVPQRHRDRGVDRAERERAFKGAAEEDRRRDEFEALSYGVSTASAGVLTDCYDRADLDAQEMQRQEDRHLLDMEGRVY